MVLTDEADRVVEVLFLGLRAEGALRKQRRGEPLTADEEEALGRWRQMSNSRKAVADRRLLGRHLGLGLAPSTASCSAASAELDRGGTPGFPVGPSLHAAASL